MKCTPELGRMTTAPFAGFFFVPLFDVNFKRVIYYIKMFLWPDFHSPSTYILIYPYFPKLSIDNIQAMTYYMHIKY